MSDLRAELRELRKKSASHMSVSKMKLKDVALEVGKLRSHLESMPSIGLDGGASKKAMKGAVESVKEAKKAEFPVRSDSFSMMRPRQLACFFPHSPDAASVVLEDI